MNKLLLLGTCLPCVKQNAAKVRIKILDFDTNLNMYFKKDEFLFAHDPEKLCKTGDVVLIRELPKRMTRLISHKIEKVVYPLGDVIDPLTNKPVIVGRYREQIEELDRMFGKSDKAFDYNKAPPRGRLEGIKDFTHGETYIKYHEDGTDQPFAV